jgi:hypothetical protein
LALNSYIISLKKYEIKKIRKIGKFILSILERMVYNGFYKRIMSILTEIPRMTNFT